jgi:S1-C subfamily serine protease
MTDQPNPENPTGSFSPAPEPRPTWSQDAWQAAAQTPPAWMEPLPPAAGPTATTPQPEPPRRGSAGLVVGAAVLAAVLATGGTVVALSATGHLNSAPTATIVATPAPTTGPSGQLASAPVNQEMIVAAAKSVSPAVVTITTHQGGTAGIDPLSLPATGVGSGILYNSNGWILTNHHVVAGATGDVTVQLNDKREFTGKVYGIDTLTDLAIVKIDATGLAAATLGNSDALQPGMTAIAIGSPLGTFTNSVTAGIVSALDRQIQVTDEQTGQPVSLHNLIQTDAAINPGNSGGALVDAAGEVIGVNTATASSAQGLGFAIPINLAKPIMQQAVAGQALTRPWIGIYYVALDPTVAKVQKTPIDYGAYVTRTDQSGQTGQGTQGGQAAPPVVPGSPADKAGVKEGDIITALNGQRIDGTHPLDELLVSHAPGETVDLQVLRGGQTIDLKLTLGTRPSTLQ